MSAMSAAGDPAAVFGVRDLRRDASSVALHQRVDARVLDHRGRVEMPAYAAMAESVSSGIYWYSFDEPVATVQAWLAMTAGAPARVGDDLRAVSELSHRDDTYGTAALTVTNAAGAAVCTGVARDVRVGRTTESLLALDKDTVAPRPVVPPPPSAAPDAIDPGWDGGRILAAIAHGDIAPGPLSELLSLRLTLSEAGPVLEVTPPPWMANPLGAVQGGVIASLIGQACSLAGQLHTGPGDDYTMADLSIHYFRSPTVDGRPLTMTTHAERVGRRLATVSATMSDPAGTVYARAVADIAYRRAS